MLDSDGTLTSDENGNGSQICSVDFPFLERVKLMLNTLGVRAKIVSGHAQGIREMPDGKTYSYLHPVRIFLSIVQE